MKLILKQQWIIMKSKMMSMNQKIMMKKMKKKVIGQPVVSQIAVDTVYRK